MTDSAYPRILNLTLLSALALSLPECSKKAATEPFADSDVVMLEGPDGGAIVETTQVVATVTSIDAPKRHVTLKLSDGSATTVACGPEVVNFPQIEVKDKVIVTRTEELAVFLSSGTPPSNIDAASVAVAPIGAKPGVRMADVVEVTADVKAVDASRRIVTLVRPDGTTLQLKAGPKVELDGVKAGDRVTARYARSIAILVEKP